MSHSRDALGHDFSLRLRLIGFLILVAGLILLVKLYMVTIVHGDEYREAADRQYRRNSGNLFDRGSIYFLDKKGIEVGAATIASGATLAINPSVIKNPETTFQSLAAIVPLDQAIFLQKAAKTNDTYEEVAKRVPRDAARLIEERALEGTIVSDEHWRIYAAGDFASHLLGFVGWEGDMLTGRYGLERYYEHVLGRSNTGVHSSLFATLFEDKPKEEEVTLEGPGNIIVSIEPSVQLEIEKTLESFNENWKADEVGALVMDPKTGALLAMASLPSFDPNLYGEVTDPSVFGNPIVENVYEMGSIAKPITVALGLDAGIVNAESTYFDAGFLDLDGKTIKNFDGKGRGTVPMQEILSQSLNTGAAYVGLKLGYDKFIEGLHRFGIGEETGIDLPNESAGLVANLSNKRDVTVATASYGQGFAVTPIMMARALSALGNGGILPNPHLIQEIRYEDGSVRRPDYTSERRVISENTSKTITRMLVKVVDDALLHGKAKLAKYTVAAKTGTAQMANSSGGYYDDRYLHSFFAYFPAYDPKFLVFMYAVYPKGATYASETLTIPTMDTARFLLSYYNIPPDR